MYWDNDEWEEKERRREKREKAKTSVECPVCNAAAGSDCYAKVKRGHIYVFSNIDDPTTKWRADAHKRLQKPHQERVDIVRPDLAKRVRRAALSIRRTEQREARVRAKNRRESAVRIAQKEAQEVRFKVGLKNARKKAYAKLCDEALEIAKRRYGDTE